MPKFYGELQEASLENLASDPSGNVAGKIWHNTTEVRVKTDDGTNKRALLRNDDKAVIGNNGTPSNNIRFHRGAAEVLQHVQGDDATAEGTLSTNLVQVSQRVENYLAAGTPSAGNAGRLVYITDEATLKVDNGASFAPIISGYTLGSRQVFTANGTWTKPAGVKAVNVTVVGGGGSGGGTVNLASIAGQGGSGAATAIAFLDSGLGATETITIGAGVAGATTDGATGGTSSFGAHVTAAGGTGGAGSTGSGPGPFGVGAGTGADYTIYGSNAGVNILLSGLIISGEGGSSPFGTGGNARAANSTGAAGVGYGAAGSGAANASAGFSARNGGSSTGGIIIVDEYY